MARRATVKRSEKGHKRKAKKEDVFLTSSPAVVGPCHLCQTNGPLSVTHVLPQAIGNRGSFLARSLHSTLSGDGDVRSRRFPNGIAFRTFCASCNSKIGGIEEPELIRFFRAVTPLVGSSLVLPLVTKVDSHCNLLGKAILASLLAANDQGYPGAF